MNSIRKSDHQDVIMKLQVSLNAETSSFFSVLPRFIQGFSHEYVKHCGTVSVVTNLFYVNNLARTDEPCMGWTW